MKVAIVGGTGKEGRGLALRLGRAGHEVIIGSREGARAEQAAGEVAAAVGRTVAGMTNRDAAGRGEVVILAVPYAAHGTTVEELRNLLAGKIVVDTVVPLSPEDPTRYVAPVDGSAAEEAQRLAPTARVVAAFHHIAAYELARLDHEVDSDLLVAGDDADAKTRILELGATIGLSGYDAGPLAMAGVLERLTPLMIGLNIRYRSRRGGLRLTGLKGP